MAPAPNLYAAWRAQRPGAEPLREDGPPPERLLQAVWQHQRLLRDQLTLADGRRVRVLHPGFHNREPGPDFRDAIVQFGAETPQRGDVEIDLAAGGWHAHRHDVNPSFRAVVLHVVWDGAGAGGLPTLALKSRLDAPLGELGEWFGGEGSTRAGELAGRCCGPLHELPREQLDAILQQAALVRLQLKAAQLAARARQCGWEQSLWEGLFAALGYKHNDWPMRRLAELAGASADKLPVELWQARLFGWSGLLPAELPRGRGADAEYLRRLWDAWWRERERFGEVILPRVAWRMGGLRPANQPLRRLALAAHWRAGGDLPARLERWFTREVADANLAGSLLDSLQPSADDFWSWHWTLKSPRLKKPKPLLGEARLTDLAVNVILPWLWARAAAGRNVPLRAAAEARFLAWPAGEDNAALRLARERLLAGSPPRGLFQNAAAQQGLLQIVRDFCEHSNALCDACRFPELVRRIGA
ncbi:MAG: Uncharacterized protein FD140_1210 [Limisphaerales bacterium]|nr:MAG: Uncharacterized protein FD140_1210 [Limisphaerales bacterium]